MKHATVTFKPLPAIARPERILFERGELTVYADGQTYLWSQIKGGWVAVADRSKR